ncbi:STAS domain-containing protein [Candidatus Uabimicrobium amorphum]|uniref:Anti-sigma factor antagonist n=1 Tax=Uabimicrobium amorphum TaxID=2596890 RepID=A0A5S9ILQ0_UABAM|nr:STAS domain-containing protein [Candidatus Uabimicrobium amorphum]BBM84024.1 anti-sigma factor antagonist [Candidatus Uabimicrobium amorphum]
MEFTIDTEYYQQDGVGEIALLQLCGPIDQKSVPIFEAEIQELFKNDICRFVLDLSNTKYLNSSGLGLLINIAHKVNVVGGGIRLVNVAEKFRVLFDMLGLDSSLPIYENRDVALRSFGSGELRLKSSDSDSIDQPAPESEVEDTSGEEEQQISSQTADPLLEDVGEEDDEDDEREAVSLLNKKTLPNLKKNLADKQDTSLKFTGAPQEEEQKQQEQQDDLYEPERPVEIEDDPNFELTGSLSALADMITDDGIASNEDTQEQEEQAPAPSEEPQLDTAPQEEAAEDEEDEEVSVSLIQKAFSDEAAKHSHSSLAHSPVEEVEQQQEEPQQEEQQEEQQVPEPTVEESAPVEQTVPQQPAASQPEPPAVAPQPQPQQTAPQQTIPVAPQPVQQPVARSSISSRQRRVVQKPIEKTLQWYTAVEYYNQMKRNRTFPLTLQVSKVDVVDGGKEFLEKLQNTNVMFVPRFPGCQVVPERVCLDISKDNLSAEFWITPFTKGDIPGWVETQYQGQTSSFVKTPFKVKNYFAVLVTFVLSFVALLSHSSQHLNFLNDYIAANQKIWVHIGVGFLLLLTSFFFLKKSSPKIDIVEKLSREKMH